MKPIYFLILTLFLTPALQSQVETDSVIKDHEKRLEEHSKLFREVRDSIRRISIELDHTNEDLSLTGTRIVSRAERAEEDPKLTLGGYVSAYYAWYSDTADQSNFQKFPTAAPQSGVFGLNIAQLTARYTSRSARANLVLHFGDIPRSVWSPVYNYVQEANAGLRLVKNLWLDAGLFRTHIGLESIQPRENIATSVAVLSYFEPYYMAGAKLTYQLSQRVALQLNAFNSFNGFTENNGKKALGLSFVYEPGSKFSLTFNTLWSDDSPDTTSLKQDRLYNNLYFIYRHGRLTLGIEGNYGFQKNTSITTGHKDASMWSALAEAKMRMVKQFYSYGRVEYFNDPDEMLTGPEYNSSQELIGLNIAGVTLGLELRPRPNSYLRLEGRVLKTHDSHEKIFLINSSPSRLREEVICSFGIWF